VYGGDDSVNSFGLHFIPRLGWAIPEEAWLRECPSCVASLMGISQKAKFQSSIWQQFQTGQGTIVSKERKEN